MRHTLRCSLIVNVQTLCTRLLEARASHLDKKVGSHISLVVVHTKHSSSRSTQSPEAPTSPNAGAVVLRVGARKHLHESICVRLLEPNHVSEQVRE
jgi:hypothetical protein